MPRPRRYYVAHHPYFASARLLQGLPFIPDSLGNTLLRGILARAQHLYPVELNDAIFMTNHFHIIFTCKDPETVSRFFCHLKTNLGKVVNRLLGRRGPVWEGRTDTPILLTLNKAVEKATYLYTNPQEGGLVTTISDYPGVSTWEGLVAGRAHYSEEYMYIRPCELAPISRSVHEHAARNRLLQSLLRIRRQKFTLTLKPLGWVRCFPGVEVRTIRERIIALVKAEETQLAAQREFPVLGAQRLVQQSMHRQHTPAKHLNRTFCLSDDIELRVNFINRYRMARNRAQEVYRAWICGDTKVRIPLGLLAPPFPNLQVAITL